MGLFDFLHRPSGKNTQEAIKEVEKMPTMMSIYREDGTQTEVLNIEEAQKFRHSDGSISSLISAKVIHVKQGDTIYLDAADPICFEIPEGRYDLAKELITRFTGMYTGIELNEKSYTYLGRAYSEEDIRLQPPTAVVNEQIGKLNEKLLEEITNKRLRESRLLEVRQKEENARNKFASFVSKAQDIEGGKLFISKVTALKPVGIKIGLEFLSQKLGDSIIILAGETTVAVKVSDNFVKQGINAGKIVGEIARATGANGGGRPNFAQGGIKDTSKIDEILAKIEKDIKA